jgi:hypothetical protein
MLLTLEVYFPAFLALAALARSRFNRLPFTIGA